MTQKCNTQYFSKKKPFKPNYAEINGLLRDRYGDGVPPGNEPELTEEEYNDYEE